ncbi:hypothetical protein [Nitrosomonas sp.]|uniref:hypothetical protein n=1 Tax=Nitrosomonas sp. TaxID=42353 RepID=UPI00208B5B36|nr:hypothetical protein [Nitrosomonas sp.]GJL76201.1 MAG: hypothetical protein NMNS02_23070 [Nitrosomonas sp.]
MKPLKNKLFFTAATLLLLCIMSTAFAESVVIKRDRIFIADRGLVVKNLDTGQINQCTAPPLLDPAGRDVTQLLNTATDVVIKHDYAIVTVHPLDGNGNPFVDTVTVDVSNCFEVKTVNVDACISTVDIQQGLMIIPCVEINGSYVTVHMDRRGKSDNWEVTFLGDNIHMKHYKRHHDHDDDDDDD